MNKEQALVAFEKHSIRRLYDEANETGQMYAIATTERAAGFKPD